MISLQFSLLFRLQNGARFHQARRSGAGPFELCAVGPGGSEARGKSRES